MAILRLPVRCRRRLRKGFPRDSLADAAARVVVGVLGAHGVVLDGDQTIEKVPGADHSVDAGHVPIGIVGVFAIRGLRLLICDCSQGVRARGIIQPSSYSSASARWPPVV